MNQIFNQMIKSVDGYFFSVAQFQREDKRDKDVDLFNAIQLNCDKFWWKHHHHYYIIAYLYVTNGMEQM